MEELENIISLDFKKIVVKIFQLSIFVVIAVAAPYFPNQLITGSIVNALLFISVVMLGIESAFFLCLMPSLVSIYTGLLPISLAPMIPFIMAGNALMALIFYKLYKRNFWAGAVPAAIIKFVFIWSAGMILANYVLSGISKNIMIMISWPQLATALAGACIAYLFLKTIHPVK